MYGILYPMLYLLQPILLLADCKIYLHIYITGGFDHLYGLVFFPLVLLQKKILIFKLNHFIKLGTVGGRDLFCQVPEYLQIFVGIPEL